MQHRQFRIFIQLRDPKTMQFIGAPEPLECYHCKRQWFSHPVIEHGTLLVECINCDTPVEVDDIFTKNEFEIPVTKP